MYRVELKDLHIKHKQGSKKQVPNVPCGVERNEEVGTVKAVIQFLMYRVELKASKLNEFPVFNHGFLMYRVELKVYLLTMWFFIFTRI